MDGPITTTVAFASVFTVQLTTTNPWLVLGVVVVVCVAVIAVKAMQTSGEKKDRESTDKKIK